MKRLIRVIDARVDYDEEDYPEEEEDVQIGESSDDDEDLTVDDEINLPQQTSQDAVTVDISYGLLLMGLETSVLLPCRSELKKLKILSKLHKKLLKLLI
ncbi:hypothetical protein DCAR_0934393 [Daucus carota subsp. sativus]|uniref:Uncharacterized protein n=1 Tax=Daucus carota subsp. sativus TaxID=79200 RepID=A0A175YAY4_DAUCS|nr:hypothetical protein DCAR_0934393 [Daucus carota subsp. sativus]